MYSPEIDSISSRHGTLLSWPPSHSLPLPLSCPSTTRDRASPHLQSPVRPRRVQGVAEGARRQGAVGGRGGAEDEPREERGERGPEEDGLGLDEAADEVEGEDGVRK